MATLVETDIDEQMPVEDWQQCLKLFCPGEKVNPDIKLTEQEAKIFELFKRVNKKHGLKTTVRVAGGWVRDKMLGKDNDDIDVAVDDMTGAEYATFVQSTLRDEGDGKVGSVGVIKANPDQSKHLETACMSVYGESIDFANLRSEVYADDSRIPEMAFGTALDDARRRDFTINALFFNVNTSSVEDFTEKGKADLKRGIVQTPLDPMTTFADDPLRVLRALKFASRYAFHLESSLLKSAMSQEIREALSLKVSASRVAKELKSMLSCDRPVLAVRMIDALTLWAAIYGFDRPEFFNDSTLHISYVTGNAIPSVGSDPVPVNQVKSSVWQEMSLQTLPLSKTLGWVWFVGNLLDESSMDRWNMYSGCHELEGQMPPLDRCRDDRLDSKCVAYGTSKEPLSSTQMRNLMFLTMIALPMANIQASIVRENPNKTKKQKQKEGLHVSKAFWFYSHVLNYNMQATKKDVKNVEVLIKCARAFQGLVSENSTSKLDRAAVAFILNDAKSLWPFAIDVALASDLVSINAWNQVHGQKKFFDSVVDGKGAGDRLTETHPKVAATVQSYEKVYLFVQNEGLDCIWKVPPLLNGKTMMKTLNLKPGPHMSSIVRAMKQWQYEHPDGTVDELVKVLTENEVVRAHIKS